MGQDRISRHPVFKTTDAVFLSTWLFNQRTEEHVVYKSTEKLCVPMFRLCSYLFYLYTGTILSHNGRSRQDLKVSFFSPDTPQEFITTKVARFPSCCGGGS